MSSLNQSSSQIKGDPHLSAHHVTIVTDAGGFVKIESPADEILDILICEHLRASADKRELCFECFPGDPGTVSKAVPL